MKRTVVITGGTKGLGRETSLAFAKAGHRVLALYASDTQAASQTQAALDEISPGNCVVRHDITSEDPFFWNRPEILEAESLVLIHNACAPFAPVPMHQLQWRDVERNLGVAVKGAWLCAQGLIRPMLKKGNGVIINVLSSAVEGMPPKGFAAYVTAKHALRGLTLATAAEYGSRGVRVLSVSPGFMETSLTGAWDERFRDAIRSASRATDPAQAARRMVELVENSVIPGSGEDYPV